MNVLQSFHNRCQPNQLELLLWFNEMNPWMSSMTSWCIPIQGAGVHVAECGGCALCRGLTPGFNKKRSIVVHLHATPNHLL